MADATLVLRDIHQATAPAWWPPAPGWWMLAALLVAVLVLWRWWRLRKVRRLQAIARVFDDAVAPASNPGEIELPAQIAAMSSLLRRAARRRHPHADTLQGEPWLALLDGNDPRRPFTQGEGRLLLEGGFRKDADAEQVAALRSLARQRFIAWMTK